MEQGGDGGIGEGGDEGTEGLEGGHPHPPALVAQQVDEEGAELCLSDGGRADAGDRHEDVCARLPHAPHPIFAEVEKFGQLRGANQSLYAWNCFSQQHLQFGSF